MAYRRVAAATTARSDKVRESVETVRPPLRIPDKPLWLGTFNCWIKRYIELLTIERTGNYETKEAGHADDGGGANIRSEIYGG